MPDVIPTVARFRSAPEVPTDMSTMRVPPEVVNDAHVAVPVFPAVAEVIVEAVKTPPDAPGAKVELNDRVASTVLPDKAVSGVAGCVPLYTIKSPLVPMAVVIALSLAFFNVLKYLRLLDNLYLLYLIFSPPTTK